MAAQSKIRNHTCTRAGQSELTCASVFIQQRAHCLASGNYVSDRSARTLLPLVIFPRPTIFWANTRRRSEREAPRVKRTHVAGQINRVPLSLAPNSRWSHFLFTEFPETSFVLLFSRGRQIFAVVSTIFASEIGRQLAGRQRCAAQSICNAFAEHFFRPQTWRPPGRTKIESENEMDSPAGTFILNNSAL